MLRAIGNIAKVKEAIANADTTRFNSTLPISIKVLKKMDNIFYKLQLGNKEFSTRSLKELEVGSKYWGDFNKTKEGIINISNLIKKPDILQNKEIFLKFNEKALMELSSLKEPKGVLKSLIIEQLANSTSKQEFVQLSNMLIALEDGIYTIPYKDRDSEGFLQYKKNDSKKSGAKSQSVEFYAAFDNLGAIGGDIYLIDEELIRASLKTQFSKTKQLLEQIKDELGFEVDITLCKEIEPLSDLESALLDLKG